MYDEKEGLLHAAEALKLSKARVLAELKVDKAFADAVEAARLMLAEFWFEEAVDEADSATGREDTPAATLRVKTRLRIAENLLPRLRAGKQEDEKSGGNHLHIHISESKAKELEEQHQRVLRTTPTRSALPSSASSDPVRVSVDRNEHQNDSTSIVEMREKTLTNYAENKLCSYGKNVDPSPGTGRGGVPRANSVGALSTFIKPPKNLNRLETNTL